MAKIASEQARIAKAQARINEVDPNGFLSAMLAEYPLMMTSSQVAEVLGLSAHTVARMARNGDFGTLKHGATRPWLIPRHTLLLYLANAI